MLGFLRRGKKVTLDQVSEDELRQERIRLDQQQAKLIHRIEALSREKERLFQQGLKEPSRERRQVLALKLKEKDAEIQHLQRQVQTLSHQIRIVNGILMVKMELATMGENRSSLLSRIPLGELAAFIERATVQAEFGREQIREMLKAVEEGTSVIGRDVAPVDEDVEEILHIWEEAQALGDEATAVQEGLKRVERVLRKEEPEEEV